MDLEEGAKKAFFPPQVAAGEAEARLRHHPLAHQGGEEVQEAEEEAFGVFHLPEGLAQRGGVALQGLGQGLALLRGLKAPAPPVLLVLLPSEEPFALQGGQGLAHRGRGEGEEGGQVHHPLGPFRQVEEEVRLGSGEAQAVGFPGEEGPFRLGQAFQEGEELLLHPYSLGPEGAEDVVGVGRPLVAGVAGLGVYGEGLLVGAEGVVAPPARVGVAPGVFRHDADELPWAL